MESHRREAIHPVITGGLAVCSGHHGNGFFGQRQHVRRWHLSRPGSSGNHLGQAAVLARRVQWSVHCKGRIPPGRRVRSPAERPVRVSTRGIRLVRLERPDRKTRPAIRRAGRLRARLSDPGRERCRVSEREPGQSRREYQRKRLPGTDRGIVDESQPGRGRSLQQLRSLRAGWLLHHRYLAAVCPVRLRIARRSAR